MEGCEITKMPYGCDLKEYTKEEYEADMRQKLAEKGLYKAVEEILDDVVDANRNYSYAHFALMTDWACDILKLIELKEGKNDNQRTGS